MKAEIKVWPNGHLSKVRLSVRRWRNAVEQSERVAEYALRQAGTARAHQQAVKMLRSGMAPAIPEVVQYEWTVAELARVIEAAHVNSALLFRVSPRTNKLSRAKACLPRMHQGRLVANNANPRNPEGLMLAPSGVMEPTDFSRVLEDFWAAANAVARNRGVRFGNPDLQRQVKHTLQRASAELLVQTGRLLALAERAMDDPQRENYPGGVFRWTKPHVPGDVRSLRERCRECGLAVERVVDVIGRKGWACWCGAVARPAGSSQQHGSL